MAAQIRVAALLFFRNSDAQLLFSKSKSLGAQTLIWFRFWGQRVLIGQVYPRWGATLNPDFRSKCLHSLLGEARLLDALELENDHNSWAFISFMIIYLD